MTHYDDAIAAVTALNKDLLDTEAALQVAQITVADQKVEIAELKTDLAACRASQTTTLFGANVGGYVPTGGETQPEAFARILRGFGNLNLIRWWPNTFFTWGPTNPPPYYGDRPVAANLGSDVTGANAGRYDDALSLICEQATRRTLLTFAHEPEDDVFKNGLFTLPQWKSAQMRLAAIVAAVNNPLVSYGPLLMGTSYHPSRYVSAAPGNVTAANWLAFDMTNIGFLGADLYQWGKDDASADHASVQFDPFLAMCALKGTAALVGELGTRRPSPPYNPGISPAKRAEYLTEALAIIDATEVDILGVCYYETAAGAADKIPWNLLTLSGPQTSQAAIDVWKGACAR